MKLIDLIENHCETDPFAFAAHDRYRFTSTLIDDDPLCERFNDTRTPHEQYEAGEDYIKFDDETIYTRGAFSQMLYEMHREPIRPRKNFKIHYPRL